MQISPDKIAEILERIDIVALISRNVKLRRAGGSYLGICPFHAEKTPSFNVNPQRRFFKCFGCDAGGDAITYVQRLQGLSFVEAVRQLAQEAGVELDVRHDPAAELRQRLLGVTATAQRHFEHCLWNDPRAKPGRNHLAARGVSEDMARRFGLGYAADAWNDLTDILVRDGAREWATQVGLVTPNRSGDGFYDTFRGRLTVPIRSAEGKTIAFGARFIEAAPGRQVGPKYLNSRESPLYRKADTLYALDMARDEIRRRKTAVLVEGYFDVIGLFSAGVRNAVALCSTALTPGHIAALHRTGAENLLMLLDGDAAGMRAIERLSGALLASGKTIRVATLPNGEDPDTFALREGAAAIEALLETAPPLSAHLLHTLLPNAQSHTLEEKMTALARMRRTLDEIPPGLAKDMFVAALASHLGVSETELRAHLRFDPSPLARHTQRPSNAASEPKRSGCAPITACEAHLAALLIADPSLRAEPEARVTDEFDALALRAILQSEQPEAALDRLDAPHRQVIDACLAQIAATLPNRETRLQALRDASRKVRLQSLDRLLRDVKARINACDKNTPDEESEPLFEEHRRLNAQRLELQKH
jgi:DNA primase